MPLPLPVPAWLTPEGAWTMPNSQLRPDNAVLLRWAFVNGQNGPTAWETVDETSDMEDLETQTAENVQFVRWVWMYFSVWGGWWGGMLHPGELLTDLYKSVQHYG